jgi:hypothetical protein
MPTPTVCLQMMWLLPEFCTQIAFNEVRGQVAAIDLGDDCYSKIQVSIFSKYFLA